MTTQDTLSGTLFAGRYRIARKLGGGGMADVYLAEDQELGRRVAVKMLHARYANDEQFVERFRREATHAAGPLAPEHRLHLRSRRVRRLVLHRHGVRRGPHAEGADPLARPLPGSGGDRVHAADPRRASVRAPQRRHPPRHQAAQRHRRRRGRRQGHGLRDRARRCEPDDRGGGDHRNGAVPLARAGAGRSGRPDLRPLLDGDRPLRAPDGRGAVHGRQPGGDRHEAPRGDAAGAVGAPPGRAERPRPRGRPGAREGAGRPVPVGRRHGRRPGDGGTRGAGRGRDGRGRDDGPRRRRRDRCHRCYPDRAPSPTSTVRTAEARTPALAVAPRDRRGARAPHRGLVLLRLDPAPDPGRGDGRRPVRRRDPAGSCEAEHHGRRADPAGPPRRQLGCRGGRRLRAEPDGGHARRQGDCRPHRRVVGQTRGDDPERRRPDRRGRGRRAHPSRTQRAGRRGQLRQGRRGPSPRSRRAPAPWSSRGRRSGSTSRRARSRSPFRTSSASPTTRRPPSSSARGSASRASTRTPTRRRASSRARRRAAARRARRARR